MSVSNGIRERRAARSCHEAIVLGKHVAAGARETTPQRAGKRRVACERSSGDRPEAAARILAE